MGVTSPPINLPQREENYINWAYGLKSWLLTLDHKRIAILYLFSVTFFFVIGGAAAALIRVDLLTPEGDLLTSDGYNRAFTLHGLFMVFFFLIPAIPAVFGNFLLPIMLGAKDLAFPRLNLGSWYVFMLGGLLTLSVVVLGGVDTGWTFYTPYSSTYSNSAVLFAGVGAFLSGFASIFTAINLIATTHKMRAPGMTWFRMPLFVWAMYATSIIIVLGTPVVSITILMVAVERLFRVGIFDPALGGDPLLFQHLFWFYSHPAVYIMILPGMGIISELITCFSRRRIFGYKVIALSSMAIALLGFLVWGHHMYVSGQSIYASFVFSIITFAIAVPSAIKVFNWTATMYKGSIQLKTPMLYAIGFLGLFTIGGLTGLFLGNAGTNVHLHDTYFVVAHFHYVMVGASIMAYLGAIHFWWPKMTGKMYSEGWAIAAVLLIFFGFMLTFLPQFVLGYLGMPRRYHFYPEEFQVWHVASTAGSTFQMVGYLIPLIYLPLSLWLGKDAGPNPWGAKGLEWEIPSPPPPHNFDKTPVVTEEAYAYTDEDRTTKE